MFHYIKLKHSLDLAVTLSIIKYAAIATDHLIGRFKFVKYRAIHSLKIIMISHLILLKLFE